jgi:hypothetical protein
MRRRRCPEQGRRGHIVQRCESSIGSEPIHEVKEESLLCLFFFSFSHSQFVLLQSTAKAALKEAKKGPKQTKEDESDECSDEDDEESRGRVRAKGRPGKRPASQSATPAVSRRKRLSRQAQEALMEGIVKLEIVHDIKKEKIVGCCKASQRDGDNNDDDDVLAGEDQAADKVKSVSKIQNMSLRLAGEQQVGGNYSELEDW